MQAVAVVKANDVIGNVVGRFRVVGIVPFQTRSIFRLKKKRSMTALTLLCQEPFAAPAKSARMSG